VGSLQYWIKYLLLGLVFFNDPLFFLNQKLGIVYSVYQALVESVFIAMLLFFWLLLMHSIASQDNISIDKQAFYLPKIVVCTLIAIYLIAMRIYVFVKFSQNPFFDLIQERHLHVAY